MGQNMQHEKEHFFYINLDDTAACTIVHAAVN